jgi:hypothetical protein
MNKVGQAGLAHYLMDKKFAEENKQVVEAVFFYLCSLILDGNAHSLATALYDKGICDQFHLSSDMKLTMTLALIMQTFSCLKSRNF